MSHRILSVAAAIAAVSPAPATAADAADERARIEEARALLQERLVDAESKGVVALKGGRADGGAGEAPGDGLREARPALRVGEIRSISCLTPDMLSETAAAIGGDPIGAIDALRKAVLDRENNLRREIELQLAVSYLVIGFSEEAGAIVRDMDDPRAVATAALADLMSGAPVGADLSVLQSCGQLSAVIREASRAQAGEEARIGDAEIQLLSSLPDPVAVPIAEIFALAAIDHGDLDLARKLEASIAEARRSGALTPAQSILRVALKGGDAPKETVIAAMAPIAAAPGPMRARAIEALSAALPATDVSRDAQAFDLDLEDAAASASDPGDRAKLYMILAGRRAMNADAEASVKALVKSVSADSSAMTAATRAASRLLGEALSAADADRRLDALAAIVTTDGFAARTLEEDTAKRAIAELTALGASDAVGAVLSDRGEPAPSIHLALAASMMRAGDYDAAWKTIEPYAAEPEFVELAFRIGAARDDPAALRIAERSAAALMNDEIAARAAWRRGDWAQAESALTKTIDEKADAKVAERLALAALANGRNSPPAALESILSTARNGGALRRLFSQPAKDPDAARAFAEGVAEEIAFIRERIAHE